MDEDNDLSDTYDIPVDVMESAEAVSLELLPAKSRILYEKEYDAFDSWCSQKKISKISEPVILAYLGLKSETMKSSTLWSKFSMLKSTLAVKKNIQIGNYPKVKAFLKRKSAGYKPKKASVFTREEVNKFLVDAADEKFLLMKVVMIMGLSGACRRDELSKMTIHDVEDKDSYIIVKIPDSKTKIQRTFVVPNNNEYKFNPAKICRKYMSLRPKAAENPRFFLQYRNGKCTVQVVGINSFAKIPSLIASFLGLPNTVKYTGHSFRRSSASLLVGSGADILRLKHHGGWRSTTVAEGYVEQSEEEKVKIGNGIFNGDIMKNSNVRVENNNTCNIKQEKPFDSVLPSSSLGINIQKNSNCTININLVKK